jgi:hypothetical protein
MTRPLAPATFLGMLELPDGRKFELWNMTETISEELGEGFTVRREKIEAAGYRVPERKEAA